ncbi:hypothetical protein CKAH01_13680 [Colletotrichum kahawae]|uniref:Heterokaryon incompatibility domain-containing protein n=1 Tax=Colletotrichum kahawae TaxID=34407 RepID=A0AAD9YNP3_COLKA|nr:hypothetical protein CKAH01_13680 [Colletotrichum kahawae]
MKENETERDVPCLVCFDLRISRYSFSRRSGLRWVGPLRKLARELTGYDPFDDDERLFVEAKSLDVTAAAGCLSCLLLKEIWGRLGHTEQLCSGEGDMKGRRGFFLYYTRYGDSGEDVPDVLFLRLKYHHYVIYTMEGQNCPWDKIIFSKRWSSFLPTLKQVRRFIRDAWLKQQIRHALEEHDELSVLPTRLVMLHDGRPQGDPGPGAPMEIRLIETSSIARTFENDVDYIALSHCWGSPDVAAQMMQTTRATIGAFTKSIPWGGLTKTFQDAMLVAKHVGIRYVWIDSLCIVQDDAQDWAGESSRMASVYENASLTIAATGATDGHQGLFINTGDEPVLRLGAHGIKLPGLQYPIYVRCYLPNRDARLKQDDPLKGLTEMPLRSRGWVFQERIMSPLTLHFTKTEVIFEDDRHRYASCECEGLYPRMPISDSSRNCLFKKEESSSELATWCTIVENYASHSLTSEADRLPALSGVATRFQQQRPPLGSYLAGLWEADILLGLHWKMTGPVQPRRQPTLARKTLLSAPPTWSWASVGGSNV